MKTCPRLTIAIPFFNTGGRVRLAVRSVQRQSFQDWELLLVDDGSTDADSRIAGEFLDDPRIRYAHDGRHLGLAPRLNDVAQAARGTYLARMDADDIMHPERLREQVAYLDANPAIDVLGSDVYFIDDKLNIRGRGKTQTHEICSRLSYIQLFHPTVMGQTAWFRKNPYSCDYLRCEDTELWIRTSHDTRFAVLPKPLLYYNRWTFQVDKSRLSLRQYREILRLHHTKICLPCRLRETVKAEARRTMYSLVDKLDMVDRYLQYSCLNIETAERAAAQSTLNRIARESREAASSGRTGWRLDSAPSSPKAVSARRGSVSVVCGEYGSEAPFNPPSDVPELQSFSAGVGAANKVVYALRKIFVANELDLGHYGTSRWNPLERWIKPGMKVVLKPNWVQHERGSLVGQDALCTHPSLIRALVDYCLIALDGKGQITIADAPLQGADFARISAQQSIHALREHYASSRVPIRFLDLRTEWAEVADGTGFIKAHHKLAGDPQGWSVVNVGSESALVSLDRPGQRFAVGDYDSQVTNVHHVNGKHEYCISNTILESDVLISIPKLKTHIKTGLTCALKNMIGVNCSKDFLPHYRLGSPSRGGDEHPDHAVLSNAVALLRPVMQSRVPVALWRLCRGLAKAAEAGPRIGPIVQGGGWSGNDTLWRTIYDVVRIAASCRTGGVRRSEPRSLLTFVDAIVCGEGEGPLRPTPTPRNLVLFGEDPGTVDCAAAEIMGFDWESIPLLRHLVDDEARTFTEFARKVDYRIDERHLAPPNSDRRPFVRPRAWPVETAAPQAPLDLVEV